MSADESTAIAVQGDRSQAELDLAQQQEDLFDDELVQTPILKLTQPTTREVQAEEAEAGQFLNTLTGEEVGSEIYFIIAHYQPGRSARDNKTGDFYVAFGETIPDRWEPYVGEAFVGTRFDEHPDAEEEYRRRVKAGEHDWGNGPGISTTHNFTGLVIVPGEEGTDEADEYQPVRLSLARAQMPAVRKIASLKKMLLRNRPFYDRVFHISTERKQFTGGTAYVAKVKLSRDTTDEERTNAFELAQHANSGNVVANEEALEDLAGDGGQADPGNKGGGADL